MEEREKMFVTLVTKTNKKAFPELGSLSCNHLAQRTSRDISRHVNVLYDTHRPTDDGSRRVFRKAIEINIRTFFLRRCRWSTFINTHNHAYVRLETSANFRSAFFFPPQKIYKDINSIKLNIFVRCAFR